ncbi:16509_t:CDS:2, partial [Racocetra persica]
KIEKIITEYESRKYYHNTILVPSIQHNCRSGELKKAYQYKTNRPQYQTCSTYSNRKDLKQSHKNEDRLIVIRSSQTISYRKAMQKTPQSEERPKIKM